MKKGFTLIELLAVIIILAIIALIAIPMVLNVIEDVKKPVPTPTPVVYYEYGTPTNSSTTDYTTLMRNVFAMLSSDGTKGVCIDDGELFCLKTNEYENSKELLKVHFGESNCTDKGSSFSCFSGVFTCGASSSGSLNCSANSTNYCCSVDADGNFNCR